MTDFDLVQEVRSPSLGILAFLGSPLSYRTLPARGTPRIGQSKTGQQQLIISPLFNGIEPDTN